VDDLSWGGRVIDCHPCPQIMARRNTKMTRPRGLDPSPLTFSFRLVPPIEPTGFTSTYIDLSQCASILARRFYRQGLNWGISGMKVYSQQAGICSVSKIPNTWVSSAAWHKAFSVWQKQSMDAINDAGAQSSVARFRDFKVFADVDHFTAGVSSNLLPQDHKGVIAVPGEWEPSQIVVPNILPDASGSIIEPIEYQLHMVGINNNAGLSRGIIEGYADSRAFPQSPDPVSPVIASSANWMRQMFDVGADTSEITENATTRNDELPYPQVNYPGGENQIPGLESHDLAVIYSTTATATVGVSRIKGGNFPCGLIRIDWVLDNGAITEALLIQIDMIPGMHRGYLAEPMQDM
jgi:hypothetical protein